MEYGLYEQVITAKLREELLNVTERCKSITPIDNIEAPKILSSYIADLLRRRLESFPNIEKDFSSQIVLVNKIISLIHNSLNESAYHEFFIDEHAEQLLALLKEEDPRIAGGKAASDILRPETSLAQSSLFTGAANEPQMYKELKKEIVSADRIDMLMSFIKWSGLRLIINELLEFTLNGGRLRVITTSYMGATDVKAVDELQQLPNTEVKINYDTKRTRLHAKAYVFYRNTGFTTAYVGSSNLSNAAVSSGLEWNIKVTKQDLPETIEKIDATFNSYWSSNEFKHYTESQREDLAKALKSERYFSSNNTESYIIDVTPYSFQQEILDKLEAERKIRNKYRNLVVAATGTGKTVISALDYKRFCSQNVNSHCRLLYVAHREEILKQSLYTFRAVLKDRNFGELFVGRYRPDTPDYLFVSIQTFLSVDFTTKTSDDFYDYIVVDEFHHAAAPSYQKLLSYYRPSILLGLTATPERMDGRSILTYFDNRIAAEIRLPEAIDRKLLSPFQYFGVTDSVNLSSLRWSAGGYDKNELTNLYTLSGAAANIRADLIVYSLLKYVADIDEVKGLGFCVSVEHANFMAAYFNSHNIPSMCLTGQSSDEERATASLRLVDGLLRFIFVVDIYNEGVDIPQINTVLFLRPTESLTVFLQQLGRGLRLSDGKDCLTVLDFIGQANRKYNFESKFSALLSNTDRSVTSEIKDGFISVPKGCYIQLEKIAEQYILENIRTSYGSSAALISKVLAFEEESGLELTLGNFLDYYHLDARYIYKYSTFSRICVGISSHKSFSETCENIMQKAFRRFAVINSRRWITFLLDILPRVANIDISLLSEIEHRMLQMFYVTIWRKTADWGSDETKNNLNSLLNSPVMFNELVELLKHQYDHIDFIDEPVQLGFDCPLDLYCSYSRDQLLVAMDFMRPSNMREGVKWLPEKSLDLFLITLNKSEKEYSPTTMYNDYSINEYLFHWQSQSTTSEGSPTGIRYITHKENNSRILLFVRENKKDFIFGEAESYTYLGTANYVSHEGSEPMNIMWQLDKPIPARFLSKTSKFIAV